jgi:hypothetical protein
MTFQEIRIIATDPCIANQLRDVNTICKRSWYIAAHIWKIYYSKICAPLLADLLLYSYESEFLQNLVKDQKIHEARAFNFTYRYIDDVLSINNPRFPRSSMFYLFEFLKNMWNCSLIQHILSYLSMTESFVNGFF